MTTIVKKKVVGSGGTKYVKYSQCQPGDLLACGVYKGHEMVPAYDTKNPPVPLHTVVDEDGTEIKLNSAGKLNHLLNSVAPGALIEIIFLGKETIKVNGRSVPCNQFEVSELVEA